MFTFRFFFPFIRFRREKKVLGGENGDFIRFPTLCPPFFAFARVRPENGGTACAPEGREAAIQRPVRETR